MSDNSSEAPRPLPKSPSIRHLKDQAKDLLRSGTVGSITEAQFKVARVYGFANWPKLKAHIDSSNDTVQLKAAIDKNDLDRAMALMIGNPGLHQARASVDEAGVGGQTAIFHAVTQFEDRGLAMTSLLLESGADLSVRARLPGHYERPDEFVDWITSRHWTGWLTGSVKKGLSAPPIARRIHLVRLYGFRPLRFDACRI